MNDTYPGTDLVFRICYSADCGKLITELSDLWVDYDSNCCVCTECRDNVRTDYESGLQWKLSIVSAARLMLGAGAAMLNEMAEG